jgi:FxLD family lantipeptide
MLRRRLSVLCRRPSGGLADIPHGSLRWRWKPQRKQFRPLRLPCLAGPATRVIRSDAHPTASWKEITVNAPITATRDAFDLDVRIVEAGPSTAMQLGDTDDGCDTLKDGDC